MVKTRPFEAHAYLSTPEDRAAYLDVLLEEGDPSLIAAGLGEIARAFGVTDFARQSGLSREAIYKGLTAGGNPTLDTLRRRRRRLGCV